jgi:hypothetical protein
MACKCKRAQIIRKGAGEFVAHLSEVWVDPELGQALYECPITMAQWLRVFPFPQFPSGGPPVFRKLPLKPDFSCYLRSKVDLACRCLAITQLAGDAAAEYAQYHLEKQAQDLEACALQLWCPVTKLDWIMEFSYSRVPCGGMPILTKVIG